jgi:geranylgeranyl diphosphate synthase type II
MRYTIFSGGKRFRPLLVLSSGQYFSVEQDVLLPFACALELIHNYSLIHDDLPSMDNDDYRRGKPSCHKAYGEDIALLAGDGLLTLAFEIMAGARLPDKYLSCKLRILQEISLSAGIRGMIGGQLLDVTFIKKEPTEENVRELILLKTGSLIIAAVKIGAILGMASPSLVEAVEKYGRHVGLAFQIKDDIMDSSQKKTRFSSKPNYVSLFGMDKAKTDLKKHVDAAIESLDRVSIQSEELCFMASKLLQL